MSEDAIRHRVWMIGARSMVEAVEAAFAAIPGTYIADGHHRAASAVKVGLKRREENPDYTGKEPSIISWQYCFRTRSLRYCL